MLPAADNSQPEAFYGFSGQSSYAAFIVESTVALTPYPLVRRFLQTQVNLDTDAVRLIVMDATGPKQSRFFAATMQSVLDTFDGRGDSVVATHELVLDIESGKYTTHEITESSIASVRPEIVSILDFTQFRGDGRGEELS